MSQTPSNAVAAGLQVGEYVLDEKIGQDGVGEIWKAHHRAWTDQFAAVKFPDDPQYLRQIQGKGYNLHRLSHPNIARIIGFDPTATPPYMMTDLVSGPTLAQLLRDGRLTVAHAVAITRQILLGLAYAHRQAIVHGDLRPENVLIEQSAAAYGYADEGCVKLAGFGLSASAQTAGAAAYAAPEQRDGAAPDARSDLFSCGVIFFEMLTGERPAGAESPSEFNPSVRQSLDEIFRHAYARRDRRYASAQEFLAALDAAAAALPAPAAPSEASPPAAIAAPRARTPFNEEAVIGLRPEDEEGPAPAPLELESYDPAPIAPPPRPPPPEAKSFEPPVAAPRPAAKSAHRPVVVIDELAHKPLRMVEELKAVFRRLYLTREMEAAEVANLRLRLDQWAESSGGLPGFGERVQITQAIDCPYHRVVVRTEFEQDGDPAAAVVEEAVMLANPAAAQDCGQMLGPEDFSLVVHLSTGVFPPTLLDMIGPPAIRFAVSNLLTAAKARAAGRPMARQELRLERANVLSLRYAFESGEHGVCFAGTSLTVVAPTAPLAKMRDEVLKRAAGLLDTDNIGAGINELRQMFLTSNRAEPRAERMLIALRAKLSASYVDLAAATCANFGLFESLEYSRRASALLPGNPEAQAHEQRVARLSFWVHAGPGFLIGVTFALFALINHSFVLGYCTAAVAAIVSGVIAWRRLGSTMSRTDAAFCHACLLPLVLAAIFAAVLHSPKNVADDVACVVMVAVVVVVDRMIFQKYSYWLIRGNSSESLGGTPLDVLNEIQTILQPDWEHLLAYYTARPPLYKHASAKIEEQAPAATDELSSDATEPG